MDQSRCAQEQLVTAHAAYMELQGALRAAAPADFRLELDDTLLENPPVHTATLAGSKQALQLALVVQVSAPHARALPHVRNGARALLRALPEGSLVTLIAYDSQVKPLANGVPAKQAMAAIPQLKEGSLERELPSLVAAVKMGIRRLGIKPAPARRLLVVISDGLNLSMKKDLFRQVGDEALAAGIPIFPVGYSPSDERGPLLNLGEIAKRSVGMFRWAKSADEIVERFESVAAGITEQLLLTFTVADACEKGHTARLVLSGQRSNPRRLSPMKPLTGWPATRLKLRKELGERWVMVLAAGGAALLVLLVGVPLAIVLAVRRGRRRAAAAPQALEEPAAEPVEDAPEQRRRKRTSARHVVDMASQIERPAVEAPLTRTKPPVEAPLTRTKPPVEAPLTRTQPPVEAPLARTQPPVEAPLARTRPPVEPTAAAPVATPPPAVTAPPARRAWLVLEGPPRPGMSLEVSPGSWRLGTAADCLQLLLSRELAVSTYHAELSLSGQGLVVQDLESRAGTRVNGQPVSRAALQDGDLLELGQAKLRVRIS